jgi:lysophospholipase L1-like esterase
MSPISYLATGLAAFLLLQGNAAAESPHPNFLEPDARILFLGDSITQAGTYIAYIDAYLYTHFPDEKFTIFNLGLGSETASGDSEPDHPFPRPCIHTRLDRILAETKPDIVFACYGMNDGIYHPIGEERFQNYIQGVRKLVRKCKAIGAKVILLTPPPFDAHSKTLKGAQLLPAGAEAYSYKDAFKGYDKVLHTYGDFIMGLDVDQSIDIHTPLKRHIRQNRKTNPDYAYGDGIHPNAAGHDVMARTILEALNAPGLDDTPNYSEIKKDNPFAPTLKLITDRRRNHSTAWREHIGHSKPQKTKAPPLPEAEENAAQLDTQIRQSLTPATAE